MAWSPGIPESELNSGYLNHEAMLLTTTLSWHRWHKKYLGTPNSQHLHPTCTLISGTRFGWAGSCRTGNTEGTSATHGGATSISLVRNTAATTLRWSWCVVDINRMLLFKWDEQDLPILDTHQQYCIGKMCDVYTLFSSHFKTLLFCISKVCYSVTLLKVCY